MTETIIHKALYHVLIAENNEIELKTLKNS